MIGPVQLLMIGMDNPEASASIRDQVVRVRDAGTVGLLDLMYLRKNRDGTVHTEQVPDPAPDEPHQPGELIGQLLRMAGAASTLSSHVAGGRGYLLRGDLLPVPEEALPPGATVLALLLEHKWAIPLRDAARTADAYPVGDAWLGREILREVQLLPPDR